jgi:hypothetical protein
MACESLAIRFESKKALEPVRARGAKMGYSAGRE